MISRMKRLGLALRGRRRTVSTATISLITIGLLAWANTRIRRVLPFDLPGVPLVDVEVVVYEYGWPLVAYRVTKSWEAMLFRSLPPPPPPTLQPDTAEGIGLPPETELVWETEQFVWSLPLGCVPVAWCVFGLAFDILAALSVLAAVVITWNYFIKHLGWTEALTKPKT